MINAGKMRSVPYPFYPLSPPSTVFSRKTLIAYFKSQSYRRRTLLCVNIKFYPYFPIIRASPSIKYVNQLLIIYIFYS